MALDAFLVEIIFAFVLAGTLLFQYGNMFRQHIIVTFSVLIAWYFSLLIIFILPLDVASTVFRQCVEQNIHNNTKNSDNTTSTPLVTCREPWPNVPENVFPNLWRIVYWTSQCLTWLILPLMQSYINAGDFTVRGKLKSALIDNAIYYGSYLFICGILLIYIALKPGLDLDGQKLKAIASSASNTWGLFLLVLLLGYALVAVPRRIWNKSKLGYTLNYKYFRVAKLSLEKCEAEEAVDDILESLQIASISIGPGHPLHCNLETIFQKIPTELKDRMNRRQLPDDTPADTPTEKSLIRLHRQTIKALQTLQRIETQWGILVGKIFNLEDIVKNQVSHDRRFKPSFPTHRALPLRIIFNPVIEWYWKCVVSIYIFKIGAICAGCLSLAVVWSEVTFFNKSPVLSIFAQIINLAKRHYDYFLIELLSAFIISYVCYCAYSTVLRIRVLNLYYLAPNHQTNEYSLIFSGMMLCRLTPPICLNFLGLIHMDSHIIKTHILETHYTQVMGHMDVISIISDGFNVYFPMAILAFCLATYFKIGSRLLSMLGFQQFLEDDEFTTDLVDEGRELIKRERRKRQRAEDSMYRRRELQERFNISVGTGSRYRTSRQSTDTVRPLKRDESVESARAGLLHDFDPAEYYIGMTFGSEGYGANNRCDEDNQGDNDSYDPSVNTRAYSTNTSRVGPPPRGLFDDI
ncbi:LMBR1 domain-containing protein 2 homolog [Pseudomyrmex gracilis]|uniref:LMBR1 domain-containing protein 2 homolog n=1 Tax=Pseudomyrmex gracilis TaxID=219809 RepID=UPI0009957846|nr:LMBR1 domain-containing protein 2 homolog [Pseudomyrmex gracilis]XP_020285108.1 LMBR1 domain-containing protein 2 homolog [Pseudomyrmex gracilis]XP_020285109.1 LMBR1 domain-containing protein 2 homolog [Pseudomyrmex gracilis]XP_020285110.1 LMBR1 domain-containing protein 2 homolog [Pseudomyrmex gracilis]